jgi:hypothetical protein
MRRASGGGDLGQLLGRQASLGAGSAFVPRSAVVTWARAAIVTWARAAIAIEVPASGARAAVSSGARAAVTVSSGARAAVRVATGARGAIRGGAAVVTPGRARAAVTVVSEVAVRAGPIVSIVSGGRQRNLGSGLSLRRGAAERRPGSCENPGGLGAHAEDSPAARGQDFEIELVEAHAEFVSGPA